MRSVVITGGRADRATLLPVAKALESTWLHIDVWLGENAQDSAVSCGGSIDEATQKLSEIEADLVIVDGDRFEILGAAIAAFLMNIPIAHLSGGDVTEGSQDNSMRHAITKLSHLHFTSNEGSSQRILNMGEEAWRVHTVGSPSVDNLLETSLLDPITTMKSLGVDAQFALVTYQPATLIPDPVGEANQLLQALRKLGLFCVFAEVNADAPGREIHAAFSRYCMEGLGLMAGNMPHQLYYSAMRHCSLMIGNSSSGFYEAPSLKVPFVNVGDRQKGRIAAESVISCSPRVEDIYAACAKSRELDCQAVVNPYGDGQSAGRIKNVILDLFASVDKTRLLTKRESELWPLTQTGNKYTAKELGAITRTKISLDSSAANTNLQKHLN